MKLITTITPKPAACRRGRLRIALVCIPAIALGVSTPSLAQKAAGATNDSDKQQSPKVLPSRFVSHEILNAHLEALSAHFSMNGRSHDPFGQLQDPSAKQAAPTIITRKRRYIQAKPISFSEIINRIQVTTIMPAKNTFLIGTRSFKTGDQFPLTYRGRGVEVEVIDVNSTQIDFKNRSNGDVASLQLNLLPAGMQLGNSGITTPGITADEENAPLVLDANSNF